MKKIIKSIFEDKKFIIIAISLAILDFFFLVIQNQNQVSFGNKSIIRYTAPIMIISQIIIFILIRIFFKNKIKLEKLFLIFGLTFGLMYMITIPIGGVPDEINHYLRSYEVSTGSLISVKKEDNVGNYLPTNISKAFNIKVMDITYKDIKNNMQYKYNSKKQFYGYANTTLYSFVSYIPQAFGILVGRILHLPILITAYLGRLCNFLVWLFVMYLCIKYIPVGKKLLFLLAFIPISLQEAISLSPDALINCLSVGLVTFVLYHIYNKHQLVKKDYILMSALCITIALVKIVYLPLCLLIILIPYQKFGSNKKDKYKIVGLIALATIVLNLVWLKISSGFLIEFNPGVNSDKQTQYILHNPYEYMVVFMRSHNVNFITYLFTLLGSNMEWLNVYISQPYLLIYFIIILYFAFKEKNIQISSHAKYLFIIIACTVVALISTSLYIQWTPYKAPEINGLIQGRYFIPILLPVLLLLTNDSNKKDIKNPEYFYYFAFALNIFVLFVLFYTHIY